MPLEPYLMVMCFRRDGLISKTGQAEAPTASRYTPGYVVSPHASCETTELPPIGLLPDIPGTVQKELSGAGFGERLPQGASIAIGVGSRGISNIATIVKSVVGFWKERGMKPFIFPAMGSHGLRRQRGRPGGRSGALRHHRRNHGPLPYSQYSLEVVSLGKTPEGIEAFLQDLPRIQKSDGIMLVGRIKQHTDFAWERSRAVCSR